MKTLAIPQDRAEIESRLATLSLDDRALWGRMTSNEVVCHLREAFRMALGELTGIVPARPFPGKLVKFMALRVPLQWMRNMPTVSQIALGEGAPQPISFSIDRAGMLAA